ncbi:hypothetical protein BDN72DRAFT_815682 [Pluteus cervinus]|uniref:Uncharacterized protein n=1 Tax=Pluteus cervinus TaxID=181527 RepID=A0ACD3B474_9AGAR|nr:hypothetical protein BDN72DRAFT_815682 [Pluteus cervinus]
MLRTRIILLGRRARPSPLSKPLHPAIAPRPSWNTRVSTLETRALTTTEAKAKASTPPTRFELPGFGLPLNFIPRAEFTESRWNSDGTAIEETVNPALGEGRDIFPSALDQVTAWKPGLPVLRLSLMSLRELTMTRLMNEITEKVDWHIKIFDETIAKKWKVEALATPDLDISEKMIDWCIEELRWKAKLPIFTEHGAISIYDGDVVKSDVSIPRSLKEALRNAVAPLEDVPEDQRDWHPGSDNQILDLVHPSLFPLLYGTSKILPDSLTTLEDCVKRCGEGVVVPVPDGPQNRWYSEKFQWLPCEVDISGEQAKITSYINNLHPQKHTELYKIVEDVITRTIPLWNTTLTSLRADRWRSRRIPFDGPQFYPIRDFKRELPRREKGEDPDDFEDRLEEWIDENRRVIQPEPGTFTPRTVPSVPHVIEEYLLPSGELKPEKTVDLKRDYAHRGLQVIVKLANIHLTPENPEYPGGTWHVEGQRNERICASAIHYFDNENITSNALAFRQMSDDSDLDTVRYDQDDHYWLKPIFGLEQYGELLQNIGGIETKEGRIITFPNTLQHQVQPFTLADPTRSGHRKILALFLVDPNIRIISTANVPCQRQDWLEELVGEEGAKKEQEGGFPITLEDAKKFRVELMDERKDFVIGHQDVMKIFTVSLCEH